MGIGGARAVGGGGWDWNRLYHLANLLLYTAEVVYLIVLEAQMQQEILHKPVSHTAHFMHCRPFSCFQCAACDWASRKMTRRTTMLDPIISRTAKNMTQNTEAAAQAHNSSQQVHLTHSIASNRKVEEDNEEVGQPASQPGAGGRRGSAGGGLY